MLIGSSLGGFVAVEAAARQAGEARHPISRLILLAPAVELEWDRWSEVGPGGIERWRQAGDIEVFHYALDRPERLEFGFYEDAERYHPASRQLVVPMLIFQGRQDESVSPDIVERFCAAAARRDAPHARRHPSAEKQPRLHLARDAQRLPVRNRRLGLSRRILFKESPESSSLL